MRPSSSAVALLFLGVLALSSAEEECIQGGNCFLPDCMCPTTSLPMDTSKIPQLVILSFDDAITVTNYDFYQDISSMKNPNGCNISMTFFISHQYNNYSLMYDLYRRGHEIALHSVTHKPDVENYWRPANYTVWKNELVDLITMVSKYGLVPEDELLGWRAPFLEIGGDEMYEALYNNFLLYDCSWTSLKYSGWYPPPPAGSEDIKPSLFPYTLEYNVGFQDCQIGKCPTQSYPGLWVFPMLDLKDGRGEACAMLDTCQGEKEGEGINTFCHEENVFNFLVENFNVHYKGNRSPLGLYSHYSWFKQNDCPDPDNDAHEQGYRRFLEYINKHDDVYIVSIKKALKWFQEQVSLDDIDSFEPFLCDTFPPRNRCVDPIDCSYKNILGLEEIFLNTCRRPCPKAYPWLGNPLGVET